MLTEQSSSGAKANDDSSPSWGKRIFRVRGSQKGQHRRQNGKFDDAMALEGSTNGSTVVVGNSVPLGPMDTSSAVKPKRARDASITHDDLRDIHDGDFDIKARYAEDQEYFSPPLPSAPVVEQGSSMVEGGSSMVVLSPLQGKDSAGLHTLGYPGLVSPSTMSIYGNAAGVGEGPMSQVDSVGPTATAGVNPSPQQTVDTVAGARYDVVRRMTSAESLDDVIYAAMHEREKRVVEMAKKLDELTEKIEPLVQEHKTEQYQKHPVDVDGMQQIQERMNRIENLVQSIMKMHSASAVDSAHGMRELMSYIDELREMTTSISKSHNVLQLHVESLVERMHGLEVKEETRMHPGNVSPIKAKVSKADLKRMLVKMTSGVDRDRGTEQQGGSSFQHAVGTIMSFVSNPDNLKRVLVPLLTILVLKKSVPSSGRKQRDQ